jgi:hypothetical protein
LKLRNQRLLGKTKNCFLPRLAPRRWTSANTPLCSGTERLGSFFFFHPPSHPDASHPLLQVRPRGHASKHQKLFTLLRFTSRVPRRNTNGLEQDFGRLLSVISDLLSTSTRPLSAACTRSNKPSLLRLPLAPSRHDRGSRAFPLSALRYSSPTPESPRTQSAGLIQRGLHRGFHTPTANISKGAASRLS